MSIYIEMLKIWTSTKQQTVVEGSLKGVISALRLWVNVDKKKCLHET